MLGKFPLTYGKWIVGKWIENPLILFANAFPMPRMALQPDRENARMIVRNSRYSSFLNISPPW
jgi:hypothetical protein